MDTVLIGRMLLAAGAALAAGVFLWPQIAAMLKRKPRVPTGDFDGSVKQITDAYDSLVAENRLLKQEIEAIRKVVGATSEVSK
jgi:hypothetical protein